MKRPELNKDISINNFNDYYWLKSELIEFCRTQNINTSGGKIELAKRILHFLETGEAIKKRDLLPKQKAKSNFDWNRAALSAETLITDNYKNTENVRAFFKQKIGAHFKLNVEFMNWMKENSGKTLSDAIVKWKEIAVQKKNKTHKTSIAPQFEYNTYIRDFLAHNPQLSLKDAIKSWKIKRSKPGSNKYESSDLTAI